MDFNGSVSVLQVYAEGYLPREVDLMVVEQHPTLLNVTLHPAKVGPVIYASPPSLAPHWPVPDFSAGEDNSSGWRWAAAAAAWWWSSDRGGGGPGPGGGAAKHQLSSRYPTPAPRHRPSSALAAPSPPPHKALPVAALLLLLTACRLS